ncbi:hypothetical protein PHLGIDRAFT_38356 [Phlebiopsis gigantea 11061_1 CR5-6]|uniref:Uncharacterized protein n=1 Tax=Phlebiopsis gigantea (strain 11061_1 CR5-6) TaxID=745531 RepID=A0A0C3S1C1_PHLG1|nr:hypothetical protein PHLGIDRAFT_38356 [Phlebiopsis gigantea 11061_1 CR5-6]
MRFSTRNAYYLRLSEGTVLPLYLYLDGQHVEWMSESVLQHVLTDLRPLIIPKLIAEESAQLGPGGSSNAKKGTVDVHRGETYQFGYFLRNTEPHSVLIKTRRFTAAPPRQNTAKTKKAKSAPTTSSKKQSSSRKKESKASAGSKRQSVVKSKGKGKQKAAELESDEDEAVELSDDEDGEEKVEISVPNDLPPRRSTRQSTVAAGGYREHDADNVVTDVEMSATKSNTIEGNAAFPDSMMGMDEQEDNPFVNVKTEESEPTLATEALAIPDEDPIAVDNDPLVDTLLNSDSEEEKPKPILKLHYQGFSIRGRALCVIVEPYPPLRRPSSLAPTGIIAPRAPSIAPPDFVPAAQRAKTPLFFPEDDRERSVTPAPRARPPVPLFDEPEGGDDDDADGGMLAFSQILHSVGEYATGAAADDDETEGAVFLGDADEARGL